MLKNLPDEYCQRCGRLIYPRYRCECGLPKETKTMTNKLNVKVKQLNEDAVIPTYAKRGDAGFDLYAVEDVIIEPGETELVKTGLAFEIPEGYEMQIRPRSGVSLKTKLRVANAPGTIDSGYRGEVGVIVDNIVTPSERFQDRAFVARGIDGKVFEDSPPVLHDTYIVRKGDRIAQGVIAPVTRANFDLTETLDDSERGSGGYGSTGVRE